MMEYSAAGIREEIGWWEEARVFQKALSEGLGSIEMHRPGRTMLIVRTDRTFLNGEEGSFEVNVDKKGKVLEAILLLRCIHPERERLYLEKFLNIDVERRAGVFLKRRLSL